MNAFLDEICSFLSQRTELPKEEVLRSIERPPNPELGDYAFPCFALARKLKQAPRIIAKSLAGRFQPTDLIERAEPAEAYLNFFVNKVKFIQMTLAEALRDGERYGLSQEGGGKTVVIDYSSPNVAKHLGVQHLRSSVIGAALRNIYEALGYNVVGINHLGDWGRQFGEIIVAYQTWGEEEKLERSPVTHLNELYVKFHQEAKQDPSLEDRARNTFKRLEDGDEEVVALWKRFREVSVREYEEVYALLGISFEHYIGESFYNEAAKELVGRLRESGFAQESQEAMIIDLSQFDMPPMLIQTGAEYTLYSTRDICAAEDRYARFAFDKMIYVVGAEQKLHFRQLFAVLDLMGHQWAKRCVHVDFGLLRFKEGKLSTREGRVILLKDVLERAVSLAKSIVEEKNPELENKEEVARAAGIGAVKFADLRARRAKDVLFDWDQVLSFEGETGPYLQYSYVRLASILRKYGGELPEEFDAALLSEPAELGLVRFVEEYNRIVVRAAEEYEPSIVSSYLIGLATAFNQYYHEHRVLSEDAALTRARVALVRVLGNILRSGLKLLGIEAPERM